MKCRLLGDRGCSEIFATVLLFLFMAWLCDKSDLLHPRENPSSHSAPVWSATDFLIIDTAAQLLKTYPAARLYDLALQHEVQTGRAHVRIDDTLPFIYPPPIALPLFLIPDSSTKTRYDVWLAAHAVLSCAFALLLMRATALETKGSLLTCGLLIATSLPWISATGDGQLIIMLALGMLGAWMLVEKHHPMLAGVLLVLAAIKPQAIAAPAIFLLMLGGRWAFLGAIATGILLFAICSILFGPGIWYSYTDLLHSLAMENGRYGIHLEQQMDARALLFFCFPSLPFNWLNGISIVLLLAAIGFAGWLAVWVRKADSRTRQLAFALCISLGTLTSAMVHQSTLLLLAIPAAFLVRHGGAPRSLRIVLFAEVLYIAAAQCESIFPPVRMLSSVALQLFLIAWSVVLLRPRTGAQP